ncbi:MAG: peptidoglycan DD-metalloendopeptidase family protein, partial [Waterburya sp.]
SFSESDLDSKSLSQSHSFSAKLARLVSKPSLKLGLTVSLVAATIYQPNSKQAVHATDLRKQTREKSTTVASQSSSATLETVPQSFSAKNYTPGFLPRILSLITSHFDNISTPKLDKQKSSSVVLPRRVNKNFNHNINLSHGSSYPQSNFYLATNTKIESSNLSSSSTASIPKSQLRIYTVRPGDTINQIASRYQVSREEIIKLNNLQNSNIIFVAQQLKIPAKLPQNTTEQPEIGLNTANTAQVSNIKLTSFDSLNKTAKSKAPIDTSSLNTRVNNSSTSAEDPYIAKLRAEIEQMRAQYQNQLRQGNSINSSTSSLPSPSLNDNTGGAYTTPENDSQDTYNQVSATPENSLQNTYNQASPTPKYDLQPNSLQEETIALKLPPLPPSEEYLPNAFDGYAWPAQGALTSGYGYRWGRLHAGIDIAAPIGTPVLAAASGEVIEAGWNSGGYGNLVKLQHLDGSVTLYGHNDRILVTLGQKVNKGEQIAEMGSTGYSTGSHLHFEIHSRSQGAVDPLAYLSN